MFPDPSLSSPSPPRPFLCPYCGDLKDRLRFIGKAEDGDDEELHVTFCNCCLTPIVWGAIVEPRIATKEEMDEFLSYDIGQESLMRAVLLSMLRDDPNPTHHGQA